MIAEPQRLFAESLRSLIEQDNRFQVCATAYTGPEAIEQYNLVRPRIAVIRSDLPGLNGADTAHTILRDHPKANILLIASEADAWCTRAAIDHGVRGCILTTCPAERLKSALHALADDLPYICPRIVDLILKNKPTSRRAANSVEAIPPPDALTPKEREVLQLIAEGLVTKEIAETASVSVKTIETHRTNMMRKLGLRNVAQVTRYAMQHGIVRSEA